MEVDCRTWFGVYGSQDSSNIPLPTRTCLNGISVSGSGCMFLIEFRLAFSVCCYRREDILRPIYNCDFFVILAVRLHVILNRLSELPTISPRFHSGLISFSKYPVDHGWRKPHTMEASKLKSPICDNFIVTNCHKIASSRPQYK